MKETLTLQATKRTSFGTGGSRGLRREGMIPAVIYGNKETPIHIAIEQKEITKYYRKPQYISQIIQFEVGEKKYKVIPKAIQLHPVTDLVHHADFVFLDSKEQKMHVPVVYANRQNCIGVKRGGYFNIIKRTIPIICPVDKLPRKLEIDTTEFGIAHRVKTKDLLLPEGARFLIDSEFVIASIIGKKGKSSVLDDEETSEEVAPDSSENKEKK